MSDNSGFIRSSIGIKFIMALSGLSLSGFVLVHMTGNLIIFMGADAYNKYSYSLTSTPLIWGARVGLFLFFMSHIANGIMVTMKNKKARAGGGYAVSACGPKAPSLYSRTMPQQGVVILVFLITHLATFTLGKVYLVNVGGVEMRDIYKLVIEVFQNPLYVAWYAIALVILNLHLSHGFSSSFQTLGFHHPKWTPMIEKAGFAYAWLVRAGFIAAPIYVFIVLAAKG